MYTVAFIIGHGGADPGAIANGLVEKDMNLTTGLACRDFLLRYFDNVRVIMTRTTDVRISYNEQRNIVQRNNADLAVEIHYNFFSNPAANGMETFILDSPKIFDLTQKAQRKIHNSVMDYLEPLGMRDRGMRRSRHWHLVNTQAPVVLVEGGFLTSPHDANILRSKAVQENVGKAIAQGIARALDLPYKGNDAEWPTIPLPKIARTVGVEVRGQRTDLVGVLMEVGGSFRTYLPVLEILKLAEQAGVEIKVTGHGDHIKIDF